MMDNLTPLSILLLAGFVALMYLNTLQKKWNVSVEADQLEVDKREVSVRADQTFLTLFTTQNARIERLETQNMDNLKRNMELNDKNHALERENDDLRRKVEKLETKVEQQASEIAELQKRLARYEQKETAA